MRFAPMYRAGAVMGFRPRDVREMSLYDFTCCVVGYRDANEIDDAETPLSDAEADSLADFIDEPPPWLN